MRSAQEKLAQDDGTQQAHYADEPQADLDPRLLRICCGNRIAPQLAEIRRPDEPALFVSVWLCPKCGKVTR
ncbi:MAG TPA: hypothetical protein VNI35_03980 [Nitrospira sp.]|nr:hypothetical protein [Nitrospira sp.]